MRTGSARRILLWTLGPTSAAAPRRIPGGCVAPRRAPAPRAEPTRPLAAGTPPSLPEHIQVGDVLCQRSAPGQSTPGWRPTPQTRLCRTNTRADACGTSTVPPWNGMTARTAGQTEMDQRRESASSHPWVRTGETFATYLAT
jgi:hypothetical protein